MKFIKENWFKISISLFLFVIAASIFYYLVLFLPQKENGNNLSHISATPISSTLNLPVTILPTDDGLSGKGMYADKYPNNFTIYTTNAIANKLSAYGLAGAVWLAPKEWTGQGLLSADGTTSVDLYPVGGSAKYGARISYYNIPACVGCMVEAAAPYFASAMQTYNSGRFGAAIPLTIPAGLIVTPISSTLITYTFPGEDGLLVHGVVYYNAGNTYDNPYFEAKFVLPASEADVSDFLIKNVIRKENLK